MVSAPLPIPTMQLMRPERRDFLPGARPVQAEALVCYGIFNERHHRHNAVRNKVPHGR
jgi:hypothetical protein